MSSVMQKKMVVATCQHCGKTTDISESSEVSKLRAAYITLKEERADLLKLMTNMRASKNGQIQAMHLTIKKLLNLMSDEQREKAAKEVRLLRGLRSEAKK